MNIRFIEGQGADPAREARDLLARRSAIASLGTIEPPEALDTSATAPPAIPWSSAAAPRRWPGPTASPAA
jgi:hypothetical protein